jgi:hypothetical protein
MTYLFKNWWEGPAVEKRWWEFIAPGTKYPLGLTPGSRDLTVIYRHGPNMSASLAKNYGKIGPGLFTLLMELVEMDYFDFMVFVWMERREWERAGRPFSPWLSEYQIERNFQELSRVHITQFFPPAARAKQRKAKHKNRQ